MEPHFPLAAQIVAVARESGGPLTRFGFGILSALAVDFATTGQAMQVAGRKS
jgi:hypothetical protein